MLIWVRSDGGAEQRRLVGAFTHCKPLGGFLSSPPLSSGVPSQRRQLLDVAKYRR
jgi:hypothetical protein